MRANAQKVFEAAYSSVLPEILMKESLEVSKNTLSVHGSDYSLCKNVYLAAFGKAALPMSLTAETLLGEHLVSGLASIPKNSFIPPACQKSKILFLPGAENNLPDPCAVHSADLIERFASERVKGDLFLVLISGGGSALLPAPVKGVTLEEKLSVIKSLSLAGAGITELNLVRQNLSRLKKGRLAQLAFPAQVLSLILSDIVRDPLDLIASGPTVRSESTPMEALRVIERYKVRAADSILNYLSSVEEATMDFGHVRNVLVGNNRKAISAAESAARSLGYEVKVIQSDLEGEARDVGARFARFTKELCLERKSNEFGSVQMDLNKPLCFLSGGETVVHVTGKGKGGRNQEMTLAFLIEIKKWEKELDQFEIGFLSAGTDGQDGPTDAAGAYVMGSDRFDLKQAEEALRENDSYTYWNRFGGLVQTGLTGTNVADVQVLMIKRV